MDEWREFIEWGSSERKFFLDYSYPLTITKDRYNGAYSNGTFIAWPLEEENVPNFYKCDDNTAMEFWYNYADKCDIEIGIGETPQEAFEDLKKKVEKALNF